MCLPRRMARGATYHIGTIEKHRFHIDLLKYLVEEGGSTIENKFAP